MLLQKRILFLILVFVSGCASTGEKLSPEEMYIRASALTKLSSAMESYVRYGSPLAGQNDAQLLAEGTKHNPALITNMGDYKIRVLSQERHAVVLMCTKAGDRALLEDAGCTGKVDAHHWKKKNVPCEFTLLLPATCAVSQGNRTGAGG
ncbi:MAG: hypothetical protein JWP72_2657 [Massilia sp.]|nr:hypothetical protein [Massilia sp.]